MQGLEKRLEDEDQVRRQIDENLDYRRLKKDLAQQEKELAALGKQLEEMEEKSELEKALNKASGQLRAAREDKVRNEAKIDTLSALQQEQQAKLSGEKFRHIEKRYRETKIKCDTTQMAVDDLQKYHKVDTHPPTHPPTHPSLLLLLCCFSSTHPPTHLPIRHCSLLSLFSSTHPPTNALSFPSSHPPTHPPTHPPPQTGPRPCPHDLPQNEDRGDQQDHPRALDPDLPR